ncbi:MAG: branched-chain amino acid ABC transporter permease [Natronomonas sp.]
MLLFTPLQSQGLAITPGIILQILIGGLVVGALWALVALGLNIIFGVMKVINIAHGELLMFGAFGTYSLYEFFGIHPAIGMFLLVPVFFAAGVLIQWAVIERVLESDNAELMSLLVTFGLFLVLNNIGRAVFGVDSRGLQVAPLNETVSLLGVNITISRIFAIVMAVITMILLYYMMTQTEFGRAMRATVQNPEMAEARGINTRMVYFVAFGLSAVLAGLAGSMVSIIYSFSVSVGFGYLIFGFLVIVFGGMGNFTGALFGALILGMIGSVGSFAIGPTARNLILLSILVVTLFVKPTGVFGGARV